MERKLPFGRRLFLRLPRNNVAVRIFEEPLCNHVHGFLPMRNQFFQIGCGKEMGMLENSSVFTRFRGEKLSCNMPVAGFVDS